MGKSLGDAVAVVEREREEGKTLSILHNLFPFARFQETEKTREGRKESGDRERKYLSKNEKKGFLHAKAKESRERYLFLKKKIRKRSE